MTWRAICLRWRPSSFDRHSSNFQLEWALEIPEPFYTMNANFAASRAATRRMRLGLFLVVIGVPTACQKSDSIPTTADRLKSVEQRQQTVPDFYVPRKAVDYMSDLKSIKENAAKPAASDSEAMYQQALAMEREGKAADAVRIFRRAARAGHGKAAKRLGDIFDRGVPGVSRDYAESLQWYQTARDLGETVEVAGKR